jgi:folate-dependent phosphoribosylglycinamide formyltransferase PurN
VVIIGDDDRASLTMNLVLLTDGSTHGQSILRALDRRGIRLRSIVLEQRSGSKIAALKRSFRRYGVWTTVEDVAALLWRRLVARFRPATPFSYASYAESVVNVSDFNSADGVRSVAVLEPDLLILGGSRILRAPVLETPRLGTLNAHPGMLPQYRGVDVIAWAIHNGDQPGVTVHRVDVGVDTGPIVLRRQLEIRPGDTLASLRRRGEDLAAELMAEAVADVVRTGTIAAIPQQRDEGKQYYRMPKGVRRAVERRLKLR